MPASNLKIRAMAKPPNMTSLASNSRESGRARIQGPGLPVRILSHSNANPAVLRCRQPEI
jgi:hypothetical protein